VIALAFAAFLLFGVMLVLVGANQAELARDLELDLAGSGLLVSLLSVGLGVGVLGAGPLVDRVARRPLFVAATLLAAAALLSIDRSMGLARAGLHLAAIGVGLGVFETLLNVAVGELHGARAAKPLSFVHAAATLGAMSGPALAAWLAALGDWSWSFRALGAGHLLLAAAAFAVPFPPHARSVRAAGSGLLPPGLARALLPFALISFAYVGIETALSVLAVPYATQTLGLAEEHGLAAISALWAGMLASRLALLLARGAIDARYLVFAGAAGALVLGVGVAARLGPLELVFGATGAALGVVFPLMVALAGERAGFARGTATGLVVGAGALGGFTLPWLHGALGDAVGPGLAVGSLAGWAGLVAGAAWAARRA
jgi:YNFM family putative membrane transporter